LERQKSITLQQTNIAIENGPFEDVFPIENGDIPFRFFQFLRAAFNQTVGALNQKMEEVPIQFTL